MHVTPHVIRLFSLLVLALPLPALGWGNHTLGTYSALETIPEVKDAPAVKVESLEQLLEAEHKGLVTLLKDEEAWARKTLPDYAPRPDGLELREDVPAGQLRQAFIRAIRLNPESRLSLFLAPLPGADVAGRPRISVDQVHVLNDQKAVNVIPFIALKEGEEVRPLDVVTTAADEPDYGLDMGLFTDNGTEAGKTYGFGEQPFGNPKLSFGTQAPFHMGFFHEADIVYKAASFLKRTYPEARAHLYQSLARYAFKTGHPYWGWRFAGWGLHYVQDLTMPYHARVLPGLSTARMLWVNSIDMLGISKPKSNAVSLVSNRHLALENYQYNQMFDAFEQGKRDNVILTAMSSGKLPGGAVAKADATYGAWNDRYLRDVLTAETAGRADDIDEALETYLPERVVDDPTYVVEVTEPDLNLFRMLEHNQKARQEMDGLLAPLMASFAAHSRVYLRGVQAP